MHIAGQYLVHMIRDGTHVTVMLNDLAFRECLMVGAQYTLSHLRKLNLKTQQGFPCMVYKQTDDTCLSEPSVLAEFPVPIFDHPFDFDETTTPQQKLVDCFVGIVTDSRADWIELNGNCLVLMTHVLIDKRKLGLRSGAAVALFNSHLVEHILDAKGQNQMTLAMCTRSSLQMLQLSADQELGHLFDQTRNPMLAVVDSMPFQVLQIYVTLERRLVEVLGNLVLPVDIYSKKTGLLSKLLQHFSQLEESRLSVERDCIREFADHDASCPFSQPSNLAKMPSLVTIQQFNAMIQDYHITGTRFSSKFDRHPQLTK